MFMFVLKTDGWHCHKIESIADAAFDAQCHIESRYTVAFGDDVEYFAEQLKISKDNIKMRG